MKAASAPAPLRLGIVGLKFGRWLMRTLTGMPGVQVSALADRRLTNHEIATLATPSEARIYADAITMFDAEALDAVVIAIAPTHRAPLLAACAARGLPLFVEKPWAGNPTQAREFAALCAPIADRVMVGFSFRFHEPVQRLGILLNGSLGPAWLANGEYAFHWDPGPDGWLWDEQGGGGVFNENSCHLLDVVCHLLGRPAWVQAATINPRQRPGPELGAVTCGFSNEAVATLTLGALGAPTIDRFPRLDLITAHGRAELRGRGHIWEHLRWATHDDTTAHELTASPEVLGSTRYTAALTHFLDTVRNGTAPTASIADGILAVDLAAALNKAARTGGRVELLEPT